MLNLQKTDRYRTKMRWNTANMQPKPLNLPKEHIKTEILCTEEYQ